MESPIQEVHLSIRLRDGLALIEAKFPASMNAVDIDRVTLQLLLEVVRLDGGSDAVALQLYRQRIDLADNEVVGWEVAYHYKSGDFSQKIDAALPTLAIEINPKADPGRLQ